MQVFGPFVLILFIHHLAAQFLNGSSVYPITVVGFPLAPAARLQVL